MLSLWRRIYFEPSLPHGIVEILLPCIAKTKCHATDYTSRGLLATVVVQDIVVISKYMADVIQYAIQMRVKYGRLSSVGTPENNARENLSLGAVSGARLFYSVPPSYIYLNL